LVTGNTAFFEPPIIRTDAQFANDSQFHSRFLGSIDHMAKKFARPSWTKDLEIGVRGMYQDNG